MLPITKANSHHLVSSVDLYTSSLSSGTSLQTANELQIRLDRSVYVINARITELPLFFVKEVQIRVHHLRQIVLNFFFLFVAFILLCNCSQTDNLPPFVCKHLREGSVKCGSVPRWSRRLWLSTLTRSEPADLVLSYLTKRRWPVLYVMQLTCSYLNLPS
jgi:hypothetical protein